MSTEPDDLTPTEARVVALLEVVRADQPRPGDALAEAVMRTVRWQVVVRGTIVLIGDLAGAMAGALGLLLGGGPSKSRGEGS